MEYDLPPVFRTDHATVSTHDPITCGDGMIDLPVLQVLHFVIYQTGRRIDISLTGE
jgi:hypothetical protein